MTRIYLIENKRLRLLMHLGVWVFATLAYTIVFSRFLPGMINMLRSILNMLPMAVLFYLNVYLARKYLEHGKYPAYFAISGLLVFVMIGVRVRINLLFPAIDPALLPASEIMSFRFGATLTNLGIWLLSILYQVIESREQTDKRKAELVLRQNEARLQSLRSQINPHFLFNTLNNIYSLAVMRSPKTADMVLMLSNLLRYITYEGQVDRADLAKEVIHIKELIALFQMRSETPLDITFKIEGLLEGIGIEPMLLIPIVENCFKHCDFDTNEKAFVKITLEVKGGKIRFSTLNSKNEANRQKDKVGGVGLENIRQRLDLKYPDQYQLEVRSTAITFELELALNVLQIASTSAPEKTVG